MIVNTIAKFLLQVSGRISKNGGYWALYDRGKDQKQNGISGEMVSSEAIKMEQGEK